MLVLCVDRNGGTFEFDMSRPFVQRIVFETKTESRGFFRRGSASDSWLMYEETSGASDQPQGAGHDLRRVIL